MERNRCNRQRMIARSRYGRAAVSCEPLERRRMLADVVYTGSSGDDSYTIRLKAGDPTQLEVIESLGGGSATTHTTPVAGIDSVSFATLSGFDLLVVDETNGPLVFN